MVWECLSGSGLEEPLGPAWAFLDGLFDLWVKERALIQNDLSSQTAMQSKAKVISISERLS